MLAAAIPGAHVGTGASMRPAIVATTIPATSSANPHVLASSRATSPAGIGRSGRSFASISASYTSFLLAPLPAFLVARLLGKPVVMNYHSGEAPDHLRRSAVARWALRTVDRNAVPSRFLVEVLREFGIPATPVPNLVELDRFQYRVRDLLRPRLLSTRNMEGLYNVACTLRAFRLIQDRYPDASLTLVGTGREEARLRALATTLGLRHVTFAGRVAHDAIAGYYADHDVYIQSPDIDNMPLSILEAFASGMPVVSTDVGGIPAILTHGQHGLLSPADDHAALAAHVIELLEAPARARALAAAAHATLARYSWTSVRAGWMALYRSLLPHRAGAGATVEARRDYGAHELTLLIRAA